MYFRDLKRDSFKLLYHTKGLLLNYIRRKNCWKKTDCWRKLQNTARLLSQENTARIFQFSSTIRFFPKHQIFPNIFWTWNAENRWTYIGVNKHWIYLSFIRLLKLIYVICVTITIEIVLQRVSVSVGKLHCHLFFSTLFIKDN